MEFIMRTRRTNSYGNDSVARRGESPLKLAVRLTLSQLSGGIEPAEAIQFAARYHVVTCAAIQAELAKSGLLSPDAFPLPKPS